MILWLLFKTYGECWHIYFLNLAIDLVGFMFKFLLSPLCLSFQWQVRLKSLYSVIQIFSCLYYQWPVSDVGWWSVQFLKPPGVRSIHVQFGDAPRSSQMAMLFLPLQSVSVVSTSLSFLCSSQKTRLYLPCFAAHILWLHPHVGQSSSRREKGEKRSVVYSTFLGPQLLWSERRVFFFLCLRVPVLPLLLSPTLPPQNCLWTGAHRSREMSIAENSPSSLNIRGPISFFLTQH